MAYLYKGNIDMLKTPLVIVILVSFIVTSMGPMPTYAQDIHLPKPGVRVHLSPPVTPPLLKGIKVHPDNPFRFDFILDPGSRSVADAHNLRQESSRLIKYFLASLTTPEADLWVNLSPYEKNRIVPESFGQTEMGRDLLAQDYMLKQITASLMYPEDEIGKRFWRRIYEESAKRYGTTNIPVNTFNKVWIVPEKAVVYENAKAGTAYVVESRLKVMLEEDYVASKKVSDTFLKGRVDKKVSDTFLHSQIIREVVIPELTKEINEGANFVQLRQVYGSLILATWYKKKIRDSILAKVYIDQNKIVGAGFTPALSRAGTSPAPTDIELIYQRYLTAFKKGVYNYIKEVTDPITHQSIPRKYFSGGADLALNSSKYGLGEVFKTVQSISKDALMGDLAMVSARIDPDNPVGDNSYWNALPFNGVNLLEFLRAQKKLKRQESPIETLEALAKQGYTEAMIKSLKAGTNEEIRLDSVIGLQSGNPKGQSIIEAVANSIDALGGSIGQFGKGVKQILDWLEDPGDRLDIVTKQEGKPAWRLTVMKDEHKAYQIQIYSMTDDDFLKATQVPGMTQGTVVRIGKVKSIVQDGQVNSLKWLKDNIHSRFGIVENIKITTQLNQQTEKINGWENREFIVPSGHQLVKSEEKWINIDFNEHEIKVVDNGSGMNISVLSGMLVPGEGGTKATESLSQGDIQEELRKIKVIHVHEPGRSVAFVRNGEVIMRIPLSETTHPDSVIEGNLALEFATLINVQQSRDKVIFPSDHDARNPWPMQLAVEQMVKGILENPMGDVQKIKYINTLVAGLEALIADNQENAYVVNDIKRMIKKKIARLINSLQSSGKYVLLPNEKGFGQLLMKQGKEVLFVNEDIFEWGAQKALESIGATIVRYNDFHLISKQTLGSKTLELIVADFTPDALRAFMNYDVRTFDFLKHHDLPKIKTNGYVIVPRQMAQRFLDLLEQRRKSPLSADEHTELLSLGERIKLLAEDEPATSYEMGAPQPTAKMNTPITPDLKVYDDGAADNQAISKFLTTPPDMTQPQEQVYVPADARMKYMLRNGDVYEIATGQKIKWVGEATTITKIRVLHGDYMWVEYKYAVAVEGDPIHHNALVFKSGSQLIWQNPMDAIGEPILSPDGRHVFYQLSNGSYTAFDTEKSKYINFLEGEIQELRKIKEMKISPDGRFIVFKIKGIMNDYHIFDMKDKSVLRLADLEGEVSFHPYSSIMELRKPNSGTANYVDLQVGIAQAESCYIDPLSGVAIFSYGDQVRLYNTETKEWLNDSEEKYREAVLGFDKDGNRAFRLKTASNKFFLKDKSFQVLLSENYKNSIMALWINGEGILGVGGAEFDLKNIFGKIYEHPRFPFLIDESNPTHTIAWSLKDSLAKFKFKGKLIGTLSRVTIIVLLEDGTLSFGMMNPRLDPNIDAGAYDESSHKIVYANSISERYMISDGLKAGGLGEIPVFVKEYPRVEFDGKYFVFYNPDNGKALYVDPDEPTKILTAPIDHFFSENPPLVLATRWTSFRKGQKIELRDLSNPKLNPISYVDYLEISPEVFVVTSNDGRQTLYASQYVFLVPPNTTVKEVKGELVLLEGPYGKSIYNLKNEKYINQNLNGEVSISDSGKFIVFTPRMTSPDKVTVFLAVNDRGGVEQAEIDALHFTNHTLKQYFIKDSEVLIQEFTSTETGIKNYQIINFVTNETIQTKKLALDHSGKIILYSSVDETTLKAYLIKNGRVIGESKVGFNIVRNNDEIFLCSFNDLYHVTIWKIRSNGDMVSINYDQILPEYWEAFVLSGEIDIVHLKDQHFIKVPTNLIPPDSTRMLVGNIYIVKDNQRGQETTYWLDLNRSSTSDLLVPDQEIQAFYSQGIWFKKDTLNNSLLDMRFQDSRLSRKYADYRLDSWVTTDNRYVLTSLDSGGYALHFNENPWLDVKGIPADFELQGINGNVFIFHNPKTDEIRFFDPQKYAHEHSNNPANDVSEEQRIRAEMLWKQVTDKRDEIVARAREAYQPVLDFLQVKDKGKLLEIFKYFYSKQKEQIKTRFKDALANGKEHVNLDDLMVESFIKKMSLLLRGLQDLKKKGNPLFPSSEHTLVDNEIGDQFYRGLSHQIFVMAMNEKISLENADIPSWLLAMTYSLKIEADHSINLVKPINEMLDLLYEIYGQKISVHICSLMVVFLSLVAKNGNKSIDIAVDQLNKLLLFSKGKGKESYLALWYEAFSHTPLEQIVLAATDRRSATELGEAQFFVDFLTNRVDHVQTKDLELPKDIQWLMQKEEGIPVENIAQFNADKRSGIDQSSMYDIAGLFTPEHIGQMMAIDNPNLRREISQYVNVQGEAGRYAAEIPQNSSDAGANKLLVRYYKDVQTGDLVEEAVDDGQGPPLGKALALLIPKSNKIKDQQNGQTVGFFGTGKFTIYSGVDRVQMIANNGQEAYVFEMKVNRTLGRVFVVKVGIANPQDFSKGVIIRRMRNSQSSIAELDQMLGQHTWKMFAGMASNEQFKLVVEKEKEEGRITEEQVKVKGKNLLTEIDLKIGQHNYGPLKLWSTQDSDMPLQIIDKKGLRVESLSLKKEFLALIPESLRKHIEELRLVIQIPLPLIQNRSSFEQEAVIMPVIQQYVALEFYKALIHQELTNPDFHISQIPRDWETSARESYWNVLSPENQTQWSLAKERSLFDVINDINAGHLISHQDLTTLKGWFEGKGVNRSFEESLVPFLAQLNVQTKDGKNSLLMRRIKTQAAISEEAARRRAKSLGIDEAGFQQALNTVDPWGAQRGALANRMSHIATMISAESLAIPEEALNSQQQRLLSLVQKIGQKLGFEQVVIVKAEAPFQGLFSRRSGHSKVYINAQLAHRMDISSNGAIHKPTNTTIHELAHLFEYFESNAQKDSFEFGVLTKNDLFTHDKKFSRFMQFLSVITLLPKTDPAQLTKPLEPTRFQNKGGIDFTANQTPLEVRNAGEEIRFNLDPSMLQKLQNAPGFKPVITNIQPMTNVSEFLGLNHPEEVYQS